MGTFQAEEAVSTVAVYRRKCTVGRNKKRPGGQTIESEIRVERSEGARLLQAF